MYLNFIYIEVNLSAFIWKKNGEKIFTFTCLMNQKAAVIISRV